MTTNNVGGNQYNQNGQNNRMVVSEGVAPQPEPQPATPRKVVLLLAANPQGTTPLLLDEEQRAIDHAVEAGSFRDRLELRAATAVRTEDLQTALLRHGPTVVHFSGHGTGRDGIVINDRHGSPQAVPPQALSDLFGIAGVGDAISCVVLNACLTREQATAIATHVPCVVGMSHLVLDRAAIAFAESFYRAIAFGRSVRAAFELGRNAVALGGGGGADIPVLIAATGIAEKMIIVA